MAYSPESAPASLDSNRIVVYRNSGGLAGAQECASAGESLKLNVTPSSNATPWGRCLRISRTRCTLTRIPVIPRKTFTLSTSSVA
eukprot:CCRYP_001392-RC/>CCRYP_001392-RC protein AED:0.48 eAED:1.00 QI:0/0/0/1/0/0/2/0/84